MEFEQENILFSGTRIVSVDVKGRMVFPTEYRDRLRATGKDETVKLVFSQHPMESCLEVGTIKEWKSRIQAFEERKKAFEERMSKQMSSMNDPEEWRKAIQWIGEWRKAIQWTGRRLYGSTKCDMDSTGRVLIPKDLRDYAEIKKKARLIGVRNRFELWDQEQYAKSYSEFQKKTDNDDNYRRAVDAFDFD